jgi:hypothetical protein
MSFLKIDYALVAKIDVTYLLTAYALQAGSASYLERKKKGTLIFSIMKFTQIIV